MWSNSTKASVIYQGNKCSLWLLYIYIAIPCELQKASTLQQYYWSPKWRGKETWQLWECTDVLVKAVLTHMTMWCLSPHTPTTLECPLRRTCVSTQYFLNSYTFFSFWFIWWTGSRKLVIDMMPAFPCLTKTWSNHIHCQAGCSLGFFLWSGQLRIDFNKIQCWQQPWKNKVWPK